MKAGVEDYNEEDKKEDKEVDKKEDNEEDNEEDKKEDKKEDIPSRFDTVPPMDLHQELLWLHKSFDLFLKRKN